GKTVTFSLRFRSKWITIGACRNCVEASSPDDVASATQRASPFRSFRKALMERGGVCLKPPSPPLPTVKTRQRPSVHPIRRMKTNLLMVHCRPLRADRLLVCTCSRISHGLRMAILLLVGLTSNVWAQLPVTELTSIFPPGGSVGSTLDVQTAGANQEEG